MDILTLLFVGLLLAVAVILTLSVRRSVLDTFKRKREQDHQLNEALHRQSTSKPNSRSATHR